MTTTQSTTEPTTLPTACVVCAAVSGPVPPTVPVERDGLLLSLRVESCADHAEFLQSELGAVLSGVRQRLSRSQWSRLREDESSEAVRAWARSAGPVGGRLGTAVRAAGHRLPGGAAQQRTQPS